MKSKGARSLSSVKRSTVKALRRRRIASWKPEITHESLTTPDWHFGNRPVGSGRVFCLLVPDANLPGRRVHECLHGPNSGDRPGVPVFYQCLAILARPALLDHAARHQFCRGFSRGTPDIPGRLLAEYLADGLHCWRTDWLAALADRSFGRGNPGTTLGLRIRNPPRQSRSVRGPFNLVDHSRKAAGAGFLRCHRGDYHRAAPRRSEVCGLCFASFLRGSCFSAAGPQTTPAQVDRRVDWSRSSRSGDRPHLFWNKRCLGHVSGGFSRRREIFGSEQQWRLQHPILALEYYFVPASLPNSPFAGAHPCGSHCPHRSIDPQPEKLAYLGQQPARSIAPLGRLRRSDHQPNTLSLQSGAPGALCLPAGFPFYRRRLAEDPNDSQFAVGGCRPGNCALLLAVHLCDGETSGPDKRAAEVVNDSGRTTD